MPADEGPPAKPGAGQASARAGPRSGDEALRALERAFAAAPEPATRAALARALERGGERARALALLAAGARAGEPAAQEALDAWHPWPGAAGAGARRAAPGTAQALVRGLERGPLEEAAAAGLPLELAQVVGATATTILALGWREQVGLRLAALDARTLRPRWSADGEPVGGAALAGDHVVFVSRDALRVFAIEDGALTGSLRLSAEGRAVGAEGDRAVVLLCAPDRTRLGLACVALDGGRPSLAWTVAQRAANDPVVVRGAHVRAHQVWLRLADGRPSPPAEVVADAALALDPARLDPTWAVGVCWTAEPGGGRPLAIDLERADGAPALRARVRGSGELVWRRPLPAWARDRTLRVALAGAGDLVLALLACEARAGLLAVAAADGALRAEVASSARGRGNWDHRSPTRPGLVVTDAGVVAFVPAAQNYHTQVARFAPSAAGDGDAGCDGDAGGDAASGARPGPRPAPRLRPPLPGGPTAVLGVRVAASAGPGAWRTAEGAPVVPAAVCAYAHQWAGGGRVWPAPRAGWAAVSPSLPVVVLEPGPAPAEVLLLVDLTTDRVVVLPLAAPARAVLGAPAGLVVAEGSYVRPGDFRAGGFTGCRVSGWALPGGGLAWAQPLGEALPQGLCAAADGGFAVEVLVAREAPRDDELTDEPERRPVAAPGPGWTPAPTAAPEGAPGPRLDWPDVAARGVLRLAGAAGAPGDPPGSAREVELAAALPAPGAADARGVAWRGLALTWDRVAARAGEDEVLRVTRATGAPGESVEVARLAWPRDARPAGERVPEDESGSRGGRAGAPRYAPGAPTLLALGALPGEGDAPEELLALAITTTSEVRALAARSWVAVVWALATPEGPLGLVALGPACLPPPRAVVPGPPGTLRLDLGRDVTLEARLEAPLELATWAPTVAP